MTHVTREQPPLESRGPDAEVAGNPPAEAEPEEARGRAAICSPLAAEHFGLAVLARGIEDNVGARLLARTSRHVELTAAGVLELAWTTGKIVCGTPGNVIAGCVPWNPLAPMGSSSSLKS